MLFFIRTSPQIDDQSVSAGPRCFSPRFSNTWVSKWILPAALFLIFFFFFAAAAGAQAPLRPAPNSLALPAEDPGVIFGKDLLGLQIYQVRDGKMEQQWFDADHLKDRRSLSLSGYVSGIVAVGRPGLFVQVNGKPMSEMRPDKNGNFSLGYYGVLEPDRRIQSPMTANGQADTAGSGTLTSKYPSGDFVPKVYGLFPPVPADTISEGAWITLSVSSGESPPEKLHIFHSRSVASDVPGSEGIRAFRLTGIRKKAIRHAYPDAEARLRAICKGIAAVETAFHTDLVRTVHVLAYDDIRNAVTFPNNRDVWFYVNTFLQESVAELAVIAEHEALHILVDRLELTADTDLRKLFADLKGYDALSAERFLLVSRGRMVSGADRNPEKESVFFEFIKERNFFPGMKGGHPEDNLDEFCVSFLHTLMYPDLLEIHLNHMSDSCNEIGPDTARQEITRTYTRLLKILQSVFAERFVAMNSDFYPPAGRFRFLQLRSPDLQNAHLQVSGSLPN